MKDYAKEVAEGMRAFSAGDDFSDNPYTENTGKYHAFRAGYQVAKYLKKPCFIGVDESDRVNSLEKENFDLRMKIETFEEESDDHAEEFNTAQPVVSAAPGWYAIYKLKDGSLTARAIAVFECLGGDWQAINGEDEVMLIAQDTGSFQSLVFSPNHEPVKDYIDRLQGQPSILHCEIDENAKVLNDSQSIIDHMREADKPPPG